MIHLWGVEKDPNFLTKWFFAIYYAGLAVDASKKVRAQQEKMARLEREMAYRQYDTRKD